MIAVPLTGCVSKGGIVQHPNAIRQHKGNQHDTGGIRVVRLTRSGRLWSLELAQPGDYLVLGSVVPYRYQGEPELNWERRDHVVRVNGKKVGLGLGGLDVKTAVALVTQHPTIQTVVCDDADVMPEPLVDALAATPGKQLVLSSHLYHEHPHDLEHLASKLADKLVYLAVQGNQVDDDVMPFLSRLTQLRWLDLSVDLVTDEGLAHLSGLTQLRGLDLRSSNLVTDAGLAHLSGLTQLRLLELSGIKVTDAGLAHLSGLTHLQDLNLGGTQVTDAGLAHLSGLTQLQDLNLGGTQVTDAGLARLSGLAQLQLGIVSN